MKFPRIVRATTEESDEHMKYKMNIQPMNSHKHWEKESGFPECDNNILIYRTERSHFCREAEAIGTGTRRA